jgi:superfamily II DNA or RNA helicase/HKD family nuclease
MPSHPRGLYEHLLTKQLADEIQELAPDFEIQRHELRTAEAADRIALHIERVVRRAVASLKDKNRADQGIALARQLIEIIGKLADTATALDLPLEPGEVLQAIVGRRPDGTPDTIAEPLIPLLDTTLLTNAPGEPRVGSQIRTEIDSADRIDLVMAFIRRSGIAPFLEPLRRHCQAGRRLRVLTTSYTGSTEAQALDALGELGAEIRVSYDTSTTRLHAKAWLFHRHSGFSTTYIGSSNLTHSAQVTGLEWNVRVAGARNADVIDKVAAVFEGYWNSDDFRDYDPEEFAKRPQAAGQPTSPTTVVISPIHVRPMPFQERMLEQLTLSRQRGHHRNLLVSATGTGKTVMAALDYKGLQSGLTGSRLLFVAHRAEILQQSHATFCQCLLDASFGELWVGGQRPQRFEHVFASIQSLDAAGYGSLKSDHFDVVIVDEFHHAAANSYQRLLDHVQPRELLGLTATPERTDGLPILDLFGGRIAAELRLWDAIDQQRLSPFVYYGVHDGLDLRQIPWRRGRGYDVEGLSNLFQANDGWAKHVVEEVRRRADDLGGMRALGFCVSVEHARFMARIFSEAGVPAVAIWADTVKADRDAALAQLASGAVRVVFSVDLFNEGVDVPLVDTLLLLRPTDSPLLFLQQLGRGLRRAEGKTVCTVLDFVGHHRKEFRFDRRLRALFPGSKKDLVRQVTEGFPFLPAGCHMELDPVATEIVLRNIRESVPDRWPAKAEELREVVRARGDVRLAEFLDEAAMDLEDVYTGTYSWSDLRQAAGLPVAPAGTYEKELRRACGRMLHIDDLERIEAYRRLLAAESAPDPSALDQRQQRLLRMLVGSVADQVVTKVTTLADGCRLLWDHPQVRAELLDLLHVLADRVDHVQFPLTREPAVPLQVHARYSRVEILAGFGVGSGAKVAPWQTGVYWAKDAKTDLFAFTLDKTDGHFSPTTRYRDFAISRELIHWESQSATRAESPTGRRYQSHETMGSSIMLFARLRQSDRAFWFLGPAKYVSHESERPMAVTWRLEHRLPGDLFAAFAAAVA